VRRTFDATGSTLSPFGLNSSIVFGADINDTVCICYRHKYPWERNVTSTFKQRIAQCNADSFTDAITLPVGGRGNSQGGQRGAWEVAGVKLGEEVRGHLCSQGVDVLGGGHWVERRPVDQFEWPGPNPKKDIITS